MTVFQMASLLSIWLSFFNHLATLLNIQIQYSNGSSEPKSFLQRIKEVAMCHEEYEFDSLKEK